MEKEHPTASVCEHNRRPEQGVPAEGPSPRPTKKHKKDIKLETKLEGHPRPSVADIAYMEIRRRRYQEGDEEELKNKWEKYMVPKYTETRKEGRRGRTLNSRFSSEKHCLIAHYPEVEWTLRSMYQQLHLDKERTMMRLLCILRQIEHSQVHVSHTLPWLRPVVIDEDVDADLEELDVAVIEEEYGWIDVDADSHVDMLMCVKMEPGGVA